MVAQRSAAEPPESVVAELSREVMVGVDRHGFVRFVCGEPLADIPRPVVGAALRDWVSPLDRSGLAALITAATSAPDRPATGRLRLDAPGQPWLSVAVENRLTDPRLGVLVVHGWPLDVATDEVVRLQALALRDPLTGLANRTLFAEQLRSALHRQARYGGVLAVLYADVDGLKEVNDAYGHATGDDLLVRVARLLARELRPSDTVGRLGGDEFAAVCADLADASVADVLAVRVREAVGAASLTVDGREVPIRVSLGVALAEPGDLADGGERLVHRADQAMYAVKRVRSS